MLFRVKKLVCGCGEGVQMGALLNHMWFCSCSFRGGDGAVKSKILVCGCGEGVQMGGGSVRVEGEGCASEGGKRYGMLA